MFKKYKVCSCVCHHNDKQARHATPCCDLTYKTYIYNGEIDVDVWGSIIKEHTGYVPTWTEYNGNIFQLIDDGKERTYEY
jgi:hypothetical protein